MLLVAVNSYVKKKTKLQTTAQLFVLFLTATMPLLFGAIHPIIVGLYTAFMLVVCGGWLLLNSRQLPAHTFNNRWIYCILFFIGWIVFTTSPLPINLLEILSPVRASSLQSVNLLAGTDIRWAPLSYDSSAGQMTAIFLFALLLYSRTLSTLLAADRSLLNRIIYTCIGLAVLEAIYGMLQVFNPHSGVLWLSNVSAFKGMARGTIIYKNQYASLLNMCWPLAIGAALLRFKMIKPTPVGKQRQKRLRLLAKKITRETMQGFLFLFLASIIMMAVIFSQSRGGTIAMLLIMILLLLFLPLKRKNKIWLTVCLLLLTFGYGSLVGFSSVINRFLSIQDSGLARIDIWLASLPMLYDHLLTGIGLGSYELLSPVYLKNFPEQILFAKAHNEYLELTIDLGIPMALFFFTTLFAAIFVRAKQLWPNRRKNISELQPRNIIAIVSFCAIAGFLFHGIADFGWHLPANLLYAVTLLVFANQDCR